MNKYLVGLAVGGIMEHPGFEYRDFEVIEAESDKEAENIYNERNDCSYYYGKVVAKLVDEEIIVEEKSIKVSTLELLEEDISLN